VRTQLYFQEFAGLGCTPMAHVESDRSPPSRDAWVAEFQCLLPQWESLCDSSKVRMVRFPCFFPINEGFRDFVGVVLLDEDDVLRPPVAPRFCYILVLYKGFYFILSLIC
jgi:hypothetical protein